MNALCGSGGRGEVGGAMGVFAIGFAGSSVRAGSVAAA
jgi:hypothetical protein